MTISNTIRTAGPYIGNGVTTVFPFYFKIFKTAELLVVQTDVATGVTTPLVINSGYTVTLNSDQNANPGGMATLPAALATGQTLVLTSDLAYLQPIDITNGGGFYPAVINAALDRLTIFCQQLFSLASRSLKFPLSDTGKNTELPSAAARANSLLGFDDQGDMVTVVPISGGVFDFALQLISSIGASLVGYRRNFVRAKKTLLDAILRRMWPTQLEYDSLQDAIDDNYYGGLRLVPNPDGTPLKFPATELTILHAIQIIGDGINSVIIQKTANAVGIRVLAPNESVVLDGFQIVGNAGGGLGAFSDTTDGIVWGRNDGANGQGAGYVSPTQGRIGNVFIQKCGLDGFSHQEGPFLEIGNLHSNENARHGFYSSPNAFDASHTEVGIISATGNGVDGIQMNWGCNAFQLLKTFANNGRGVLLNKTFGCAGQVFGELNGGVNLELSADTGYNDIMMAFSNDANKWINGNATNIVRGASLGNNGPLWSDRTNTNVLYVRNQFKQAGDASIYPIGQFKLRYDLDYTATVGDATNPTHVKWDAAGGSVQNIAVWRSSFNALGLGAVSLNVGNEYIHFWEIGGGQTLMLGTPKDGRETSVINTSGTNAFVSGQIGGGATTITLVPGGVINLKYFGNATTWRIIGRYTP